MYEDDIYVKTTSTTIIQCDIRWNLAAGSCGQNGGKESLLVVPGWSDCCCRAAVSACTEAAVAASSWCVSCCDVITLIGPRTVVGFVMRQKRFLTQCALVSGVTTCNKRFIETNYISHTQRLTYILTKRLCHIYEDDIYVKTTSTTIIQCYKLLVSDLSSKFQLCAPHTVHCTVYSVVYLLYCNRRGLPKDVNVHEMFLA
jgi:hypothetical protein